MKPAIAIGLGLLLAACGEPAARPVAPAAIPVKPPMPTTGLERVMGQNASGLTQLFGNADADIREGAARKLQYRGSFCVLDTYLYPESGKEPVVTYIDTRQPDGRPIDRASCVAALMRRSGGK